jgi:hypothetical protein
VINVSFFANETVPEMRAGQAVMFTEPTEEALHAIPCGGASVRLKIGINREAKKVAASPSRPYTTREATLYSLFRFAGVVNAEKGLARYFTFHGL